MNFTSYVGNAGIPLKILSQQAHMALFPVGVQISHRNSAGTILVLPCTGRLKYGLLLCASD